MEVKTNCSKKYPVHEKLEYIKTYEICLPSFSKCIVYYFAVIIDGFIFINIPVL